MTVARGVSEPSVAKAMGEGVGVASHPKLIEGEVRVIGRRWSPRVHAIKAFLARKRLGLEAEPDSRSYDLVIVGGGPAGLAGWRELGVGGHGGPRSAGLHPCRAGPQAEREVRARLAIGSGPYMLETSKPGVFVAGDVRKGSIKRLAR